MNKILQKSSVALGIALAIGAAQVAPAMAAEPETASSNISEIADSAVLEDLVTRATPYVSLIDGRFVLDETAAAADLNGDQIAYALKLIASSNETISTAIADGSVATEGSTAITLTSARAAAAAAFKQGVTKVEVQWYGFRVWLSRDTIRAIGGGAAVGALWIPEPLVSKILASLGGLTAAAAPGGVVFNYTPIISLSTPFGIFWGQEFQ